MPGEIGWRDDVVEAPPLSTGPKGDVPKGAVSGAGSNLSVAVSFDAIRGRHLLAAEAENK